MPRAELLSGLCGFFRLSSFSRSPLARTAVVRHLSSSSKCSGSWNILQQCRRVLSPRSGQSTKRDLASRRLLISGGIMAVPKASTSDSPCVSILQSARGSVGSLITDFTNADMCRDTLGTALYFGFYDTIRSYVRRHASPNTKPGGQAQLFGLPGPVVSFLSGSTAGIASWLIGESYQHAAPNLVAPSTDLAQRR